MKNPRSRLAAKIFEEVVELPKQECAERLEILCEGDDELRKEVESLLRALPDAERYFASRKSR